MHNGDIISTCFKFSTTAILIERPNIVSLRINSNSMEILKNTFITPPFRNFVRLKVLFVVFRWRAIHSVFACDGSLLLLVTEGENAQNNTRLTSHAENFILWIMWFFMLPFTVRVFPSPFFQTPHWLSTTYFLPLLYSCKWY